MEERKQRIDALFTAEYYTILKEAKKLLKLSPFLTATGLTESELAAEFYVCLTANIALPVAIDALYGKAFLDYLRHEYQTPETVMEPCYIDAIPALFGTGPQTAVDLPRLTDQETEYLIQSKCADLNKSKTAVRMTRYRLKKKLKSLSA